jgi:Fur family ferric uptake transcriptional regulator
MHSGQQALRDLKTGGHRLTRVRRALIHVFSKTDILLSMADLRRNLSDQIQCDRTTIYREILFLEKKKIIRAIQFGDGKKRYKMCPDHHHHHIICLRCGKAKDVVLRKGLVRHESTISRLHQFKIAYHTLEFFGLCRDCQRDFTQIGDKNGLEFDTT